MSAVEPGSGTRIAAAPPCALCGLERAAGLEAVVGGSSRRFCCHGCLQVYSILHESGQLDRMEAAAQYRAGCDLGLLSAAGSEAPAVEPAGEPGAVKEVSLHLSGLWCASCGWLVEAALRRMRGVLSVEVLFASDLLRVRFDPTRLSLLQIQERVLSLGYQAEEHPEDRPRWGQLESQKLLLRLGVAAILSMNVMTLNILLYDGYWTDLGDNVERLLPWVLLFFSLPCVFWAGWPILSRGARALRQGTANMETLISISIYATFGYSTYLTVTGGVFVYFDTVTMLVTLVLLGRFLETLARERARTSVTALYRRLPRKARVRAGDGEKWIGIETLECGDVVLVDAGETVPADGRALEGSASVDESMLTGEARPVARGPGDELVGGTSLLDGRLAVFVTRVGGETVLARILRSVEGALASKSAAERRADRASRVFAPVVLLLAAGTAAGWLLAGREPGQAILAAVTVLIISCPCSLGIATPIAMVAAVGRAAQRGILVADSGALERAGALRTLFFDKTGTLTEGRFSLRETLPLALDSDSALGLAAALEAGVRHPIGRALVRGAEERGIEPAAAPGVRSLAGRGLAAEIGGLDCRIGAREVLDVPLPDAAVRWAAEREGRGHTVVFLARGGECASVFALGDTLRAGARDAVAALRAEGVEPRLLSGDARATTEAVGREAGVESWSGGLTPEDKVAALEAARAGGGAVAMVGDGVNDAPALAHADVGIALGTGTHVAIGAAPVTLLSEDLGRLSEVVRLARATQRVIRQNLFWAFAYNLVAITVAMFGLFNLTRFPIVAVITMLCSSLSVTLNSLRLRSS